MTSSTTLTDASLEPDQGIDVARPDRIEKAGHDAEAAGFPEWHLDPENPLNWPTWRKTLLAVMMGSQALTA